MKVLIIDLVHEVLVEELEKNGFDCDYKPDITSEETIKNLKDYQGLILRSKIKLTADLLKQNKHLKFIGRVGSGLENIDTETANALGIAVFNSPEGNRDSVAEHTVALILNLLHKVCSSFELIKQGKWLREENRGFELMGKTVGIIGYGNMGEATAKRLRSFGVNILAYDKYKTGFGDQYLREVDLQTIFEHADILSLHLPLTEETKYMVDKRFIKKFRKNFYLINTSRGQIVKTADLVKFLKKGKIYGAALDVLEYEKHNFEMNLDNEDLNYLMQAPNVILTPHIAGLTQQSYYKLSKVMAEKIILAMKS